MGNAYVAGIDNAFRITPDGVITQIIDRTGDGIGHSLVGASSIVPSDATGDVYVSGSGFGGSNNVFLITPAGLITQVLDASGDGMGQGLIFPLTLAVDASGTLFVAGLFSSNVFRAIPGSACLARTTAWPSPVPPVARAQSLPSAAASSAPAMSP